MGAGALRFGLRVAVRFGWGKRICLGQTEPLRQGSVGGLANDAAKLVQALAVERADEHARDPHAAFKLESVDHAARALRVLELVGLVVDQDCGTRSAPISA